MYKSHSEDQEFKELQDEFLSEVPERFDRIEVHALKIESTGNFQESVRKLFAEVHSLKGVSATHGFQFLVTICHRMEDALTRSLNNANEAPLSRSDLQSLYQFLTACIDEMRALTQSFQKGEKPTALSPSITPPHPLPFVQFRALIVDPSQTISRVVSRWLETKGFIVSFSLNGYEALGRILAEPFDWVVTGLQTQPLDGLSLIAAVRSAQSSSSSLYTILLTSNTSSEMFRKSAELGPHSILTKNLTLVSSLEKVLSEWLPQRKAPLRILFVDDDEDIHRVAKASFKKAPHLQVTFALGPEQALTELQNGSFEVLITDQQMPKLSGAELLAAVTSQLPSGKCPPIRIVLTGEDRPEVLSQIRAVAKDPELRIENKANCVKKLYELF